MAFLTGVAGTGNALYFTDETGEPYLLRWDTVWALICNAGVSGGATTWQSDMDNYCTARAAEGFNGFLVTTTGSLACGANADGTTWDGVAPFTSPGVLNNTFWTRVDYLLAAAASHGMTIVLNIMFTYALNTAGGCIYGWTNTQYGNYGTAVGTRYAATSNVVWELGDDYGWAGAGGQVYDAQFDAVVTGLTHAGADQLLSVECQQEGSSRYAADGSASYTWGIANAGWNWCYGYNCAYNTVEDAYGEPAAHTVDPLVVCRMDGWYDNEGAATTENIELFGRKSIWWSLSSGSRGYMYGNKVVFPWGAGVIANGYVSATPGAQYMQPLAMQTIFDTFAGLTGWHKLVPDTASALVTAGRGTRAAEKPAGTDASSQYTGGNTYVTASITADGTLAVIYIPSNVTITVNGALMAAGYGAWWIDPASGTRTAATIAATYNNPAANSAGDHDWVLALIAPPNATWTVP